MPDRLVQHSTTQILRRVGFGLLIAAVVVELASEPFATLRTFARSQWSKAVDDVLPRENRFVDLALGVLASAKELG
jgi:hypothetical protein